MFLLNIFFIGAGNCTEIILEKMQNCIKKAYLLDYDVEKINFLKEKFHFCIESDFFISDDIDFYVECASVEAVKKYTENIIRNNKNIIILSSGAFSDFDFRNNVENILKNSRSQIFIPSGAIGGIDIINSLKDEINSITIETRKPPLSFNMINTKEELIFFGTAEEAIKNYPKNINVAITLSMAVESFDKVKVKIISDPKIIKNIHKIFIDSKAGKYEIKIENNPSNNPKTSLMAPLSVVGFLKKFNNSIKVGV